MKTSSLKTFNSALLLLAIFAIASCVDVKEEQIAELEFPVEIEVLKTKERVRQIEYFGIVSSKIINYSFLTPGRVKSIFVSKNQFVQKGTKLMQLETKGFTLALNVAKNQEKQAKSAYLEAQKYYQNLEKVFKLGGVSGTDIEKEKLDRDLKYKDWEQSKMNSDAKNEDFKQTTLIAQTNGIVSDILPKVGELIDAGAETIIIQGKGLFAETALSQKDLEIVKKGTKVIVEIKNKKVYGEVNYIATLPDFQTFRHTVKIDFSNNNSIKASIGLTAKIYFETDTLQGIWIPIKYISNNGQDFVNLSEDNRLRKKVVQIIDFSGEEVRVSGLAENDKLITKGAASIKEGYKVKILK
jgi:RND family efflux transporter MFP subunit